MQVVQIRMFVFHFTHAINYLLTNGTMICLTIQKRRDLTLSYLLKSIVVNKKMNYAQQ